MDINITLSVGLNQDARNWIMSALGDKLKASVDAAATRVQNDIASLKAQIAAGPANGLTDEEVAELQTKLDQIDPATSTTLPPVPATV